MENFNGVSFIFIFIFIGICFTLYFFIQKRNPSNKGEDRKTSEWTSIEVTLEEVMQAVRQFSLNLPEGVSRTILVKENHEIDFKQLAPILQGIPSEPFYMSKETYDIFEEKDKQIPPVLDQVQQAVDLYVKDHKQFPVLAYDPLRRVNYFLLVKGHYLKEAPEFDLYITNYDGIISPHKPKERSKH
ncbi:DUF3939 domain-containing protein [Bacillus sp. B15-48]|uniref:DUF3939 domain-containing protein n=1 Tax=Bacillus sp. B15-48 TaxID=1548601 RepID=UPI00193EE81B|nr:DUF3939 domain-containing protein [Bacillus sp. B15-48]MBM4764091.1 DUF3939 domain-containing protein [Bacillus sp. B15-48]